MIIEVFTYNGTDYDLPVTDPEMEKSYFRYFPSSKQGPRDIIPKNPDRCLLVISLGTPFKGYHYKIMTTLLEY